MLVAFPEHYRLYEHIKKTEKDGKTEVKTKTHAAGGNERQDAYLYGHPAGRRKRYRSPADFFPHLLWLCTDESGDPDNCGCKICSPEDLEDLLPGTKSKVKQESDSKSAGSMMSRQGSGQGLTKIKQEPGGPTPVQRPTNSPRPLVPTPLAPPKSSDQNIDRQYNTFMFRPGELVWFSRGQAWGLGVILRRWVTRANEYYYAVSPLSHPFGTAPEVVKSSDSELRPWLAWSVPQYTTKYLNQLTESWTYESADWDGLFQKRYGEKGDLDVDGSILAAKGIDATYTLFGPNNTTQTSPDTTETRYDGIFLGAEKIWIGDALRLSTTNGTDILVLHSVVSSTTRTSPPSVHLIGDIYTLQPVPHTNPNIPTPASPHNNPQLPQRITEDLIYRNARSIPAKGVAHFRKLVSVGSRIELNDIKGRWYEASLLLPILQPQVFDEHARRGEVQEATLWMNARGDCLNSNRASTLPKLPRQNNHKQTRREAFGRSIPASATIRDEGVDPSQPENIDPALSGGQNGGNMDIDPRFETADTRNDSDEIMVSRPGQDTAAGPTSSGFEEFMNLDGEDERTGEEGMPGFGQQYGNQEQGAGYY